MSMTKVAAGLMAMIATVTMSAAAATAFKGTVEQVDKARGEVSVVDDQGKPAGKPAWFAVTDQTKVTRAGKGVSLADAKLKVGEAVTIVVNAGDEAGTEFTCPMHPEIADAKAGKCPKCGMNLKERARLAKAAEVQVR